MAAPPHPALAHLTPTPRLLRLPAAPQLAEPTLCAPTHLLRPVVASAGQTHKSCVPGWPTPSSPGRSTDSSSDGGWQHASWERPRPGGETHETNPGDQGVEATPERPPPVAVPGLTTPSLAVTPREAGGGTLPWQSPVRLLSSGKSSAKRSPSKKFDVTTGDVTTGGTPRRAAPDRSVLVPFDDPPFRPERTAPQALPEDVLQAARARSNPSRSPVHDSWPLPPHPVARVLVQDARAHYDVPGMLGRTERCYLQVCVCTATRRVSSVAVG